MFREQMFGFVEVMSKYKIWEVFWQEYSIDFADLQVNSVMCKVFIRLSKRCF